VSGVLRSIWPDAVTDFHGFDPEEEIVSSMHVIDVAKTIGFEIVDEANDLRIV
jgi:hypothetical protein